ncbi:MAG: O-methyltransferase [Bacteroidota bacterium]|nr:O-methyltransferase [Bacteroidota bacterium]
MELVNPLAEQYAARFTTPQDELLHSIHQQSLQHKHAHLLSTETQGQLLSFLSQMVQPKYILEIGTFTGYSALCLCKGLSPDGELHTIELREKDAEQSSANFKLAKKEKQIHLYRGDATQIIPTLNYNWDIVFIDADKTNYIAYYEMVLERLQIHGLIIADNVLFHGQVLEKSSKNKNAEAIHQFNQHVLNDNRTEQVLLTVRDGLLVIRKKETNILR